jgi:hypothetical protein
MNQFDSREIAQFDRGRRLVSVGDLTVRLPDGPPAVTLRAAQLIRAILQPVQIVEEHR